MPVIPQPHVHLKAALDAIDEHEAHHQARVQHHMAEITALGTLRAQYLDVLGQVAPDEPAPVVTTINIITPEAIGGTQVGDLTVFDAHGRLQV